MGSKRGFSSMDPQKQREIASKGGKAAHQKGTAHEFTTEEARVAGRKGGAASRARRHAERSGGANPAETSDMARPDEQPSEMPQQTSGEETTSSQ